MSGKTLILFGTGHRPDKLGGYGSEIVKKTISVAKLGLNQLIDEGYEITKVISGMALGWDQALAEAAEELALSWEAYVPFEGQEKAWPLSSQQKYHKLLAKANNTIIVCEGGYASWKMQKRNEAMVNASNAGLALWNGTSGGTRNCIYYAEEKSIPVRNMWSYWE
jgi:uncharacterized phage-like protein YoqJ